MDLNTIIVLGLCVVILIILVVMYLKDKQADKKFERFEQVLTDNMQENFILKKEIEKIKETIDAMDLGKFGEVIDEEMEQRLMPLKKSIETIGEMISNLRK
ncbi:MAG: hypothetical protein IJT33_07975 [Campylobacter sp.]|uniref:hypothetical protein n=1 Tax=unclassified Campylobacter TaxID=2593542 RepID=UPI001B120E7D|nr:MULTISPECIES: hypothetical protein [unclassified Campylobacter]MBO7370251.1 hypothetical protein [Campylobacter sp.]MBP5778979.1 hypothetical protein [Campylobacter sp.]MBQ2430466.1 hypothetical protein [Campylobacter sp.]MBQ6224280.1 hypothetical protein [Campylobacter sp.]MBQ7676375.1 hypothetical protein [Campylobacter sp.]